MRTYETQLNRIAIGPRTRSPAGSDAAFRSADVFDDNGLSKQPLIGSAISRPISSRGPPAGFGTITVMGRVG
jgi:hypothetical protein